MMPQEENLAKFLRFLSVGLRDGVKMDLRKKILTSELTQDHAQWLHFINIY
jgi:hypothetical protein